MTKKPVTARPKDQQYPRPDQFDPASCEFDCAFCYARAPDPKIVENLDQDIEELRTQFTQLQKDATTDTQLVQLVGRLDEIAKTIDRASAKSKELKADIVLPPKEVMDVRLVPSHSLDRLDEYRSDENKAYLLIGAFCGTILGILANWATDENFTITRPSLVFMGVFLVLALLSITWAYQISRRAKKVREEMLSPKGSTKS